MITVEWRPVPDWEGLYEVSNEGQVRSLGRLVERRHTRPYWRPEQVLSTHRHPFGYPMVDLKFQGRKTTQTVHKLVLLACARTHRARWRGAITADEFQAESDCHYEKIMNGFSRVGTAQVTAPARGSVRTGTVQSVVQGLVPGGERS